MRRSAKERAVVHPGGWMSWESPDFPGRVRLRFVDQAGRLVPVDVAVVSDELVTANLLRSIPIGRLEAHANRPSRARALRQWMDRPGTDVLDVRLAMEGKRVADDEPAYPELEWLVEQVGGPGRDKGDEFYRRIAAVYDELYSLHGAPTTAIAEGARVPVSTAKRWIREARARGFLPPARQGKAG